MGTSPVAVKLELCPRWRQEVWWLPSERGISAPGFQGPDKSTLRLAGQPSTIGCHQYYSMFPCAQISLVNFAHSTPRDTKLISCIFSGPSRPQQYTTELAQLVGDFGTRPGINIDGAYVGELWT
jgi:hypothetical protein